jgi:hypothetical protein
MASWNDVSSSSLFFLTLPANMAPLSYSDAEIRQLTFVDAL